MMNAVNIMRDRELEREAERVLRGILEGFPDLQVEASGDSVPDAGCDLAVKADRGRIQLCVQVKSRVTPQTALAVRERFRGLPQRMIPVIFAPTISPRVAEVLRGQGIGYADRGGNCWLRSVRDHLLIERQGFRTERQTTPPAADPFAAKSSRIVRAILSRPTAGWQVRALAEQPDVRVSPGLVVKVKRALLEEGYAVERERLLYLRDPVGLLNAWSQNYPGPAEEFPLYFRGDAGAAEQAVSRWCRDNALHYALAGFSAAWRLAAEVRYSVGAVYVEGRGFDLKLLDQLRVEYGGKRVDSGANLHLWRPFDRSVFAGRMQAAFDDSGSSSEVQAAESSPWVTSPLQAWLDLKRSGGRGEDAANAIFEKHLARDFQAVIERKQEAPHASV
jgi:hypothetical protein